MKKLLTLVLALAMTLSLAACGGGGEDTADEGSEGSTSGEPTKMTLILRGGAYGESLEASLAPFEAEHNVDIEVMLMSFDDLHTGIALDAVNEVGTYDLCMVDGSWMAEFTENGVLANLSEMGYSFDDDIIPATTTICKVGEDIYLAPYYGNVTVMMYNKQLLADAGLIKILSIDDKRVYFDPTTTTHGHFLCRKCGKLFDIPVDENEIFKSATSVRDNIAQIERMEIFFYGLCSDCLKI